MGEQYELKNGKNMGTRTFLSNPKLPNLQSHIEQCRKAYIGKTGDDEIEDEYGIYPYIEEEMDALLSVNTHKEKVQVQKRPYAVEDDDYKYTLSKPTILNLEDALREIELAYSGSTNYYYKVISNAGIPQSRRLLQFLTEFA